MKSLKDFQELALGLCGLVLLFGILVGVFGCKIVEAIVPTPGDALIPDTETIIQAMCAKVPDNAPMIRSTIRFAAATDTIEATYDPEDPIVVTVKGTGYSSTEIPYRFTICLGNIAAGWEVLQWTWEEEVQP